MLPIMLERYCLVSLGRRTVTSAAGWASAPHLPPLRCTSSRALFPSHTETFVFRGSNISFCTSGTSVFLFSVNSVCILPPTLVFTQHEVKTRFLSRPVNMLFLIYYLLPMCCTSECSKQLFRFCSYNHRARCLALVLQHLCFPLPVYLKFILPRFIYSPFFSQTQQLVNSQSTREKKLLLITFDK